MDHYPSSYQKSVGLKPRSDDHDHDYDYDIISNGDSNKRKRVIAIIGVALLMAFVAFLLPTLHTGRPIDRQSLDQTVIDSSITFSESTLPTMMHTDSTQEEQSRKDHILQTLRELQTKLKGTIYFASDDNSGHDFDRAAHAWRVSNIVSNPPWAVIEVAHEADVQLTIPVLVELQQTYSFPFSIRSGGHNKAGYSTVGQGAVVSLVRLHQLELLDDTIEDENTAVARMGPAVLVQQFVAELLIPKGYGGVIGYCGTVAEAGFIMGGGLGLQSRLFGLGADNVKAFRIVLADGTAHHVSNDDDNDRLSRDLFFALRGAGGGSFGVVTQIDYYVHKTSNQIYVPEVFLDNPDDMATFLYRLGQKEPELPGNIVAMHDLVGSVTMFFTGRTDEEVEAGKDYLDQLIEEIHPEGVPRNIKQAPVSNWSDSYSLQDFQGTWGEQVWAAGCWYGFLKPENNTEEIWKDINRHIAKGIQESGPYLLPDVEFWGGRIKETKWNETAFPHRDAVFNLGVLLQIPADTEDAEAVFQEHFHKVNQWWPKVEQYLQGSFVNYPMVAMEARDYPRVYWGDNLPRLVDIKRRVDPQNAFRFPLSVPMHL